MSYDPITRRGVGQIDASKSKGKGGKVPTITSDRRAKDKASNTGHKEISTTKRPDEKTSGTPVADNERGYAGESYGKPSIRRIHDGVKTGPGIIHKDGRPRG